MPCDLNDANKAQAPTPDLPDGVPPLVCFYIYLSDNCNLRCRHCWIVPRFTGGKPDPGRCVDVDALLGAVREAKALGLRSAKLTGGEPMLHPRFMEVAERLSAEGLSLHMETNGTLLTAGAARDLRDKTRLTFVSVSLDGADAQTHDAFRGVQGAFDGALRALSHLAEAGYKNTQVIMSVHRGNRAQVDALVQLAAARGAASVKLNPVTRTGRGVMMHERGEGLDFDELMELARFVDHDLGPRAPIDVIVNIPPALASLRKLRRSGASCGDCGVRGILGVLGTNQYALCGIGSTCSEFVYGRLGKDSVRDIWLSNPTVLHLRRALADVGSFPGICVRCIFARTCRTGCVADNYVRTGQLIATEWMCAEALRRGVFPSARAQRRNESRRDKVGEGGLSLSLADGQRWLICPVDDKAATVVAELGKVMRLGHGDEGRGLYVAVSEEHDSAARLDSGTGDSVVCCLPDPTSPDMRAVGMERITAKVASASLVRGGLLLRAALAEHQGSGFAMAAPSGAGKSTAGSRLRPPWRLLCDDMTLVVQDLSGRWWAHPWPTWSRFFSEGPGGSWPVEHAVPLQAIFFLTQSPSDGLEPIKPTQSAALILESAENLTREASRMPDVGSVRTRVGREVSAAKVLASAVPVYSVNLILYDRFWEEIGRVLPKSASAASGDPSHRQRSQPVEPFIVPDSRRLVYTGTSMSPTLVEPELLQVEPYGSGRVRPGDVVCFKSLDRGLTIVHRVVVAGPDGIRTRGDGNRDDDPRVLRSADIIGRVKAAQSGTRRRTIHGGWRGFALLLWQRMRREIARLAGSVPHKLYSIAAGFGPFDLLLPQIFRPRLVRFEARDEVLLKLVAGRQTVGQFDDRRGLWSIRRPFRLFVNEQALGRAAVAANSHRDARAEALRPSDAEPAAMRTSLNARL